MLSFRLHLAEDQKTQLRKKLKKAEKAGNLPLVKRLLSIPALYGGRSVGEVAAILTVSTEAVRGWIKRFLLDGIRGLEAKKSPGRPPKLSQTQR
jgi:transposase